MSATAPVAEAMDEDTSRRRSLVATLEGVGFWASGLPSWDAARAYVATGVLPGNPPTRPSPQLLAPNERRRAPDSVAVALDVALAACVALVFGALAERHVAPGIRASVSRQVRWGAVLMPLGFFAGGVLDSEAIPRSVSCWAPWGPGC